MLLYFLRVLHHGNAVVRHQTVSEEVEDTGVACEFSSGPVEQVAARTVRAGVALVRAV